MPPTFRLSMLFSRLMISKSFGAFCVFRLRSSLMVWGYPRPRGRLVPSLLDVSSERTLNFLEHQLHLPSHTSSISSIPPSQSPLCFRLESWSKAWVDLFIPLYYTRPPQCSAHSQPRPGHPPCPRAPSSVPRASTFRQRGLPTR